MLHTEQGLQAASLHVPLLMSVLLPALDPAQPALRRSCLQVRAEKCFHMPPSSALRSCMCVCVTPGGGSLSVSAQAPLCCIHGH